MDLRMQRAVKEICSRIDARSSGTLLSAYVIGSRADGTQVPSSDLDLLLIPEADTELDRAVLSACASVLPEVRVDFLVRSLDHYEKHGGPCLSATGIHVFGPDVTERIPAERFEPYFARKLLGFVNYQRIVRATEDLLRYPVEAPGRQPFLGYQRNGILTDAGFRAGFRTLVNLITAGSTVLVGVATGELIYSKKRSVDAYAALTDDGFVDFAVEAYQLLNRELLYELPTQPALIERTAALCRRVPHFENHVLGAVRERFAGWPSLSPEPLRRQVMASSS